MKKISALLLALCVSALLFAQDSTITQPPTDTSAIISPTPAPTTAKKVNKWSKLNLSNRPKDHLLIQLSYDNWSRMPDTVQTKGLSRGFNVYFMFDFPFKSNPQYSVAIGAGISTSNIYFDKTYIDISGKSADRLSFQDVSDTTHFKKFKLLNSFLEAPVELRYVANPANPNKSWKAAIGAKIGTMISATTKGKTFQSSSGQTLNAYTQKEKAKRFFNGTRLSATGRIGYGSLSLFASYQVNAFIKEGFGPDIRPYSIGLTISGL